MIPSIPSGLTPTQQNVDAHTHVGQLQLKQTTGTEAKQDAAAAEAAQQFEAIFLRQLLSTLERGGQLFGSSKAAGSSVYGSMMVNALATHTAEAGGMGLADLVTKALMVPPSNGDPGPVSDPR